MKIGIIIGSVRDGRHSQKVGYAIQSRLNKRPGIEAQLLDLAAAELPMYTEKWRAQNPEHGALHHFSRQLQEADGLVFLTPEYHGSYTGVLKNCIDHFWTEFHHKPIGVVSTSTGKFGGINASTKLQQLVLSINAYPMPYKLIVPYVDKVFDAEGQIADVQFETNLDSFVEELLWLTVAIAAAKAN